MFSTIVTAQALYFAARDLFLPGTRDFNMADLQTILLTALVGVCPVFILYFASHVSRRTYFTLVVPLHLLTTLSAVIGVLLWRGSIAPGQLFIPVPLFMALYIGFHIRGERINKKAIEKLNQKIHEAQQLL